WEFLGVSVLYIGFYTENCWKKRWVRLVEWHVLMLPLVRHSPKSGGGSPCSHGVPPFGGIHGSETGTLSPFRLRLVGHAARVPSYSTFPRRLSAERSSAPILPHAITHVQQKLSINDSHSDLNLRHQPVSRTRRV